MQQPSFISAAPTLTHKQPRHQTAPPLSPSISVAGGPTSATCAAQADSPLDPGARLILATFSADTGD